MLKKYFLLNIISIFLMISAVSAENDTVNNTTDSIVDDGMINMTLNETNNTNKTEYTTPIGPGCGNYTFNPLLIEYEEKSNNKNNTNNVSMKNTGIPLGILGLICLIGLFYRIKK